MKLTLEMLSFIVLHQCSPLAREQNVTSQFLHHVFIRVSKVLGAGDFNRLGGLEDFITFNDFSDDKKLNYNEMLEFADNKPVKVDNGKSYVSTEYLCMVFIVTNRTPFDFFERLEYSTISQTVKRNYYVHPRIDLYVRLYNLEGI